MSDQDKLNPTALPFGQSETKPSVQSQKIGVKKVSSQKSIFDAMPKKQTPQEFEQKVQKVQEKMSGYKLRTSELAVQFSQAMQDKTLQQNKNMFQQEVELELLRNMVKLAQEINADEQENDGEGSLSWITVLLKTCFNQRDRMNRLEYQLQQVQRVMESNNKAFSEQLLALDKKQRGE
jgi:hypothetical protein